MNKTYQNNSSSSSTEAQQGRVALLLTARLQQGTQAMPHDITERLRVGRERALALAQQQRRVRTAAATAPAVVSMGGRAAALGGPPSFWLRMASVLPLALLVAGMVLIQHHHDAEQINAAAEIDTALLADELPPDAYRDPGFGEFLRGGNAP
mgnify:CR=1 FL=1